MNGLRKSLKGWDWATDVGEARALYSLTVRGKVNQRHDPCTFAQVRHPIIVPPLFAGFCGGLFSLAKTVVCQEIQTPHHSDIFFFVLDPCKSSA
jgi:hypothetical protein